MATVLTPRPPKRVEHAFSLVEVTLALGVVAVSLLSLLGLLPAGLGVLRESMDQTVYTQIVQRVASEVSVTDFDSLANTTFSFDEQGQLVKGQGTANARYSVQIQGSDPSLPGLTRDEDIKKLQSHLKRVRIGISRSNVLNAPVAWYAVQVACR